MNEWIVMHNFSSDGQKPLSLSSLKEIVQILRQEIPSQNIILALAARFWTATLTKEGRGYFFTARKLGFKYDKMLEVKIYIISFLKVLLGRNPSVCFPKGIEIGSIENLYISWALPTDLNNLKSGIDRYFGNFPRTNRDLLICWIIGKPTPQFIEFLESENMGYIIKRYSFSRVRAFLKIFGLAFRHGGIFGMLRTIPIITGEMVSGISLAQQMIAALPDQKRLRSLSLPYEAQPIQNTLIYFLKKSLPDLFVHGYIHASMCAFPSYYFKRHGAPDKLFVHGSSYKRVLVDYLGWKESEVQVISTLRFKKKKPTDYSGRIYLPYDYPNPTLMGQEIEIIINSLGSGYRRPEVRLHPVKANSSPHVELKSNIDKILDANAKSFDENGRDLTVVVGLTAALLEALENDVEVIQIVSDPAIETYSSEIWTELESHPISSYSTKYALKVKGAFVVYGEDQTIPITQLVARQ